MAYVINYITDWKIMFGTYAVIIGTRTRITDDLTQAKKWLAQSGEAGLYRLICNTKDHYWGLKPNDCPNPTAIGSCSSRAQFKRNCRESKLSMTEASVIEITEPQYIALLHTHTMMV
jgi:hypothetical protein